MSHGDEIVPFELLTSKLTFIFILGQKSLVSNPRTGGYYIRTNLNFINRQVGSSKFTRYFLLNFLLISYIYIYLLFIYIYLLIFTIITTSTYIFPKHPLYKYCLLPIFIIFLGVQMLKLKRRLEFVSFS